MKISRQATSLWKTEEDDDISVQHQSDICVTYFQFQYPLFVSFYSVADERQLK